MEIWKRGIDFAKNTYKVVDRLPDTEKCGLKSRMTRAAVSIPSNIAEASSRKGKDFYHLLRVDLGSTYELDTQCIIAKDLMEDTEIFNNHINRLIIEQKMFVNFLKSESK